MIVENVEIENSVTNSTIILSVRPYERDSCCCRIVSAQCSTTNSLNMA